MIKMVPIGQLQFIEITVRGNRIIKILFITPSRKEIRTRKHLQTLSSDNLNSFVTNHKNEDIRPMSQNIRTYTNQII